MANGRTISANVLTAFDIRVIGLCEQLSNGLEELIKDVNGKKDFKKNFGKISYSRDGGMGLGGGKLQRDALCTRGKQGRAPWSNRNLRWHPLVISDEPISYASIVNSIRVAYDEKVLIFNVTDENGFQKDYRSEDVHLLSKRYTVTSEKWEPLSKVLRTWGETDWTRNSCCIPAAESCDWYDAVEAYAVLGIAIASQKYSADFMECYSKTLDLLSNQSVNKNVKLPSEKFPTEIKDIICDPLSKIPISSSLDEFRFEKRPESWTPNWLTSKRSEGDDSSLQVTHVKPLIESEIRHNAKYVRYGFRWSNVAMTDHSLEETISFIERIIALNKE